MTVKERLKTFVKFKKISASAFCNSIGVSNAFISSMRKSIQPDKVESIATNYPELNIEWLLTGEGDMLKAMQQTKNHNSIPKGGVPYWNLPVSAGKSISDIIGAQTPDGYIKGLPGIDIAENILPVTGTSMEPEISNGAIIGVRKMNNWESLNTERIYLIITQDDRMIKRIEYDTQKDDILWCVSPNYPRFKIFKSDIIEIQRVCFVYNPK